MSVGMASYQGHHGEYWFSKIPVFALSQISSWAINTDSVFFSKGQTGSLPSFS